MATYNKFTDFPRALLAGEHDFDVDQFHIILTNTLPDASDAVYSDILEIAAQNGYTTGGEQVSVVLAIVSGAARVSSSPVVFGAAGGAFGPFQYAVLFNYSSTNQGLVSWWEYPGGSISLQDTETLTVVFDSTNGIFKVQ